MALKRVFFAFCIAAASVWLHYNKDSANILSTEARKLAYLACAPANPNTQILIFCQLADEKWFGIDSLRSTLHSAFDHATAPMMKREMKLMEEDMRFKAANAFKSNYNDMRAVAAITATEQQEWVLQMSGRLDHMVSDLLSSEIVAHLLARSKHNTYWSSATNNTITQESWVFASRMLNGRRHTWLLQFEAAVDTVREQLQHPGAILKEIDTNKYFKTPQLSKDDKFVLLAKEMLILFGSLRFLSCFA